MSATVDFKQPKQLDSDAAVEAVSDRHEGLKVMKEEIEEFFVFPEGRRPDIVYNKFDLDLPIIDLAPVFNLERLNKEIAESEGKSDTIVKRIHGDIDACEQAKALVEKQIRAACEDYGFFQIINHGFPVEVADQFMECGRKVFDLPIEEKMKARAEGRPGMPAPGSYHPLKRSPAIEEDKLNSHIWNEGFDMESPEISVPGRLDEMISKLWPRPDRSAEGQRLRSSYEEYGKQAKSLCFLLLDLIAASIGVPKGSIEDLLGYGRQEPMRGRLRINHFPVCAQPQLTWGIDGHTDPTVITLLYQDNVGGLQIGVKDGTWHGVRPIPGAFVVNIGDYGKVWTNGRFLSAMHRVVANEKARRMSIAYFVSPTLDCVVKPRPELVDGEHYPIRYKPMTRREYLTAFAKYGVGRKRTQILDQVFGIAPTTQL